MYTYITDTMQRNTLPNQILILYDTVGHISKFCTNLDK